MRLRVHVRPGASRTSVGGQHDGTLVVRVQQRAVNGAATAAVEVALATAFAVSPSAVTCVKGHLTRRKTVEITGDNAALERRLAELLGETLLP